MAVKQIKNLTGAFWSNFFTTISCVAIIIFVVAVLGNTYKLSSGKETSSSNSSKTSNTIDGEGK